MTLPENRSAPADGAGASDDLLGGGFTYEDTNYVRISEDERLLVGALVLCPPGTRARVFAMLMVDDFQHPLCGDAFGILRELHGAGVHDSADLVQRFMDYVNTRRRAPRRPGDSIPLKYAEGPASWLASCYTAAARTPDISSAVLLALPMVGTGRRRAIAHAASELARAASNLEFDDDDIAAATERLLPLLDRCRVVAG